MTEKEINRFRFFNALRVCLLVFLASTIPAAAVGAGIMWLGLELFSWLGE